MIEECEDFLANLESTTSSSRQTIRIIDNYSGDANKTDVTDVTNVSNDQRYSAIAAIFNVEEALRALLAKNIPPAMHCAFRKNI